MLKSNPAENQARNSGALVDQALQAKLSVS
jgi:hypothetical protein